jgi:hypothetical protein
MSVTIGDTSPIDTCAWCETVFQVRDSPRDNYCSHDCYYRDKGQGALNQLKSDHKICATCFRYIKQVSAPEETWVEEKADRVETALNHGGELTDGPDGEITLDATDCSNTRHTQAESIVGYQYPTENTKYLYGNSGKWICSCGNVETHKRDDILEQLDLDVTVSLLLQRLSDLYDKGAIQNAPTQQTFTDEFDTEELNWQYAIGKALYDQ